MLNHMHKELAPPGAAGKKKKQAGGAKGAAAAAAASASSNSSIGTGSIVHQTFQGEIKITTTIKGDDAAAAAAAEAAKASAMDTSDGGAAAAASAAAEHGTKTTVEHKPFLYLSLALPAAPLFKDASTSDRAIIPQVPLFELLKKFDGVTVERGIDPATKREFERTYTITRLPRYLLLHYQRFHENNWFFEKNPTLVNFPLQRMDMRPYTSPSSADAVDLTAENGPSSTTEALRALPVAELKRLARAKGVPNVDRIVEKDELVRALQQQQNVAGTAPTSTYYNLLSNIVHEGVVGAGSKSLGGSYKCFSLHRATNTWYLTEDLHVHTSETMEQQVALTESYIQIYERQ
jgi:U4/U6.U5 tri-snRNP-associated protein 2